MIKKIHIYDLYQADPNGGRKLSNKKMKVNCHGAKTDMNFKSRRWTEVTLLGKFTQS